MASKEKPNLNFKKIILLILFLFVIGFSFNFGLHWHGTLSEKIYPNKLTCYGHNNFWETFQINCYSPLNEKQKNFKFSDHLECKLLTNHQLYNSDKNFQLKSNYYNEVSLIKTDYRSFTLDLNYKKNQITKSRDPGEPKKDPFVIIQNDGSVINAIRKNKLDSFFGFEYQYITFSKKTGKGIIYWINTQDYSQQDSLASEFFQCK